MSDFARIFNLLSKFHHESWNNSDVKILPGRHPVESLRVRYWFEGLRQRTALTTAYALEKYFEEEFFRKSSDGKILHYPSKWSRYEQGVITPKAKTLKRVEILAPGSTRELEHPIWSVLRNMHNKYFDPEKIMRCLSSYIQAVIFSTDFTGLSSYSMRQPITGRLLDKLERHPSLDSVACLICLLLEAAEQKRTRRTEKITRVLHNVLLMIGIELQARGIALPFLDLIVTHCLPLGDRPYLKAVMTSRDYVEASAYLNLMAYQNPQSRKKSLDWEQRVRVMHQLVHGERGMDVEFAMRPQFELREEIYELPSEVVQNYNRESKRRVWGWNCIRSGVSEPMPPADLFS